MLSFIVFLSGLDNNLSALVRFAICQSGYVHEHSTYIVRGMARKARLHFGTPTLHIVTHEEKGKNKQKNMEWFAGEEPDPIGFKHRINRWWNQAPKTLHASVVDISLQLSGQKDYKETTVQF